MSRASVPWKCERRLWLAAVVMTWASIYAMVAIGFGWI